MCLAHPGNRHSMHLLLSRPDDCWKNCHWPRNGRHHQCCTGVAVRKHSSAYAWTNHRDGAVYPYRWYRYRLLGGLWLQWLHQQLPVAIPHCLPNRLCRGSDCYVLLSSWLGPIISSLADTASLHWSQRVHVGLHAMAEKLKRSIHSAYYVMAHLRRIRLESSIPKSRTQSPLKRQNLVAGKIASQTAVSWAGSVSLSPALPKRFRNSPGQTSSPTTLHMSWSTVLVWTRDKLCYCLVVFSCGFLLHRSSHGKFAPFRVS